MCGDLQPLEYTSLRVDAMSKKPGLQLLDLRTSSTGGIVFVQVSVGLGYNKMPPPAWLMSFLQADLIHPDKSLQYEWPVLESLSYY